jgi:hypothetical protein
VLARKALGRLGKIACFVLRAPCLPSRIRVHLLAHEISGLRTGRLALVFVALSALQCFVLLTAGWLTYTFEDFFR